MFKATLIISIFILSISLFSSAQKNNTVYVDNNGIMRWNKTKLKVKGFGENYTMPFAYAYRNAKKLNLNIEKEIDRDVYHFAKLGFDLYRVHVWDVEISDTLGNLLNNEHLKMFDYLVMRLKERGIKMVITPIAFWGNGWPEPDEKTPGFAAKYGKDGCLKNPEAIKAQQNYLFQFLNHVNSYTNIALKDDDDVLVFEVSNEPHHRGSVDTVKQFINGMVAAMRKTGCKKPILYNISHSVQSAEAYLNADIQGGTFQWYPTNLGSGFELGGNLLPNVDRYTIPYTSDPKYKKQAKIVYEFDAADVGRSYIYPAMARSFREAGLQIATHFAYDPTYSAYANTEYGTHYMNLLYTPQKALSLKIAGEVFRRIPLYQNYCGYPQDTLFGPFHISYENDLAEMITDEQFIYTNHTTSKIPNAEKLKEIAGFGNSSIVQYEGTGAYFLDQLADGIWRLEVLPDAIWIEDPFTKTSLQKTIAVLNHRNWTMNLQLPNLGKDFSIRNLQQEPILHNASSFQVKPGVYILSRSGKKDTIKNNYAYKKMTVGETANVPGTLTKTYVLHKPLHEASAGKEMTITAKVVCAEEPVSVEVYIQTPGRWFRTVKMEKKSGYDYSITIPSDQLAPGYIQYNFTVIEKEKTTSFPGAVPGYAWSWDYYATEKYQVPVVASAQPVYLFNAATDANELSREWRRRNQLLPSSEPGKAELIIQLDSLIMIDGENPFGEKQTDYSMRYFFGKKTFGRINDFNSKKSIVFKARSKAGKPIPFQIALVTKDAEAFGSIVMIDTVAKEYIIPFSELKNIKLVTLPRPYPGFLPYFFESKSKTNFNVEQTECLQFSIGPGLSADELRKKYGIAIEWVRIE